MNLNGLQEWAMRAMKCVTQIDANYYAENGKCRNKRNVVDSLLIGISHISAS